MKTLIDSYGRIHRDLRVSLTDRCSLRCTYCLPNDFSDWLPSEHLLTTEELLIVIATAVDSGIEEVRLTGGEPLLRPDIINIVERIANLENAPKLSLTTNGLRLIDLAKPLANAGLTRINVSLDTLDREKFTSITKRDRIADVFSGLDAARAAGLTPIKINSVLIAGVNDDEAIKLLRWALNENFELRFIEQMPLDAGKIWVRDKLVTANRIFTDLSSEFKLTPVASRGSSPAEEFYVDDSLKKVGIIASVTEPFCGACDRIRLTSDGQIRSCLFSHEEIDLRKILRDSSKSIIEIKLEIASRFQKTVQSKLPGHGINDPKFIQPNRPMSAIGG